MSLHPYSSVKRCPLVLFLLIYLCIWDLKTSGLSCYYHLWFSGPPHSVKLTCQVPFSIWFLKFNCLYLRIVFLLPHTSLTSFFPLFFIPPYDTSHHCTYYSVFHTITFVCLACSYNTPFRVGCAYCCGFVQDLLQWSSDLCWIA